MLCARFVVLGIIALVLLGCSSSQCSLTILPSLPINTWLLGVWKYSDTKGNRYQAGIFPVDDTHYSIEVRPLSGPNKYLGTRYFNAFISRVDRMYFLNIIPKGPVSSEEANCVFFVHYQLQSPIEVIITPLDLSVGGKSTPWKLRQKIRALKKACMLLPPEKSTYWRKTAEVYWQQNASLESQPKQLLRIPIPNPKVPSQDAALQIGPTKGYQLKR